MRNEYSCKLFALEMCVNANFALKHNDWMAFKCLLQLPHTQKNSDKKSFILKVVFRVQRKHLWCTVQEMPCGKDTAIVLGKKSEEKNA